MEIALIIMALLAAGLGLAAWRLNARTADAGSDDEAAECKRLAESLNETERDLAVARNALAERERECDRSLQERDAARERLKDSEAKLAHTTAALATAEATRAANSAALAVAAEERDTARERLGEAEKTLANKAAELAEVKADHEARQQEIAKQQAALNTHFKGIASEVVKSTSEEFRKQAEADFKRQRELTDQEAETRRQAVNTIVKPVGESLEKLQQRVGEIEKARENAYGRVEELIDSTRLQIGQLDKTANDLRKALASPQKRGRWGELTLERVLEVAGMREHVDYNRQEHASGGDGAIRPDAVIRMPRGMTVPVDAKTPLDSYMRAHEAEDDDKQRDALQQHAKSLMSHARSLASKNYASGIDGASPSFVVLFVPTETILDAAMTAQPSIWEDAWIQHHVLIASPGLLIALLRTVGLAWQQEQAHQNAQEIARTAGELYSRLATYTGHIAKVGSTLEQAVAAHNKSVGSFQTRVLVQARRMEDLGVINQSQQIDDLEPINTDVRALQAPELLEHASLD